MSTPEEQQQEQQEQQSAANPEHLNQRDNMDGNSEEDNEDDDGDVEEIPNEEETDSRSHHQRSPSSPSSSGAAATASLLSSPTTAQLPQIGSLPGNATTASGYQDFVDRLRADIVGFEKMTRAQAAQMRKQNHNNNNNNNNSKSRASMAVGTAGTTVDGGVIVSEDILSSKEDDKPFIAYHLHVSYGDARWMVIKRYTSFLNLYKSLPVESSREPVQFPPKKFLGNMNANFIEKRKNGLNKFLSQVMSRRTVLKSDLLLAFLETPEEIRDLINYGYKVVFFGASRSGKTSMINRYLKGTFSAEIDPTVGASFSRKTLELQNSTIELGVWDTAGQERYNSMAPMYYRRSRAIVIVFDVAKDAVTLNQSFDVVAKFWMNRVKEGTKDPLNKPNDNVCLFLVGNKIDLVQPPDPSSSSPPSDSRRERVVSREAAVQFATENGATYMETSSKTGENIDELFKAIASAIMNKEETEKKQPNHKQQQQQQHPGSST